MCGMRVSCRSYEDTAVKRVYKLGRAQFLDVYCEASVDIETDGQIDEQIKIKNVDEKRRSMA